MSNRVLDFGLLARTQIISGVNELVKAVSVTLGPKGRNVLITDSIGQQHITKDGVTVAKAVQFKDNLKNAGAQLVKQVASQSNEQAGDGTTTATVLAGELINQGHKLIVSGAAPIDLQRGISLAAEDVYAALAHQKIDVTTNEQIERVATISTNNDVELGKIIADLMSKVGVNGAVKVEESLNADTTINITEGLEFDRGYLSAHFAPSGQFAGLDVSVLVADRSFENLQEIVPLIEAVSKNKTPLLIIAHDFAPAIINFIALNCSKGVINVCLVKAPSFGINRSAELKDIAVLTGATLIDGAIHGKSDIGPKSLGQICNLQVTVKKTLIAGGRGDQDVIEQHLASLGEEIKTLEATNDDTKAYDLNRLRTRFSKLSNGVGVVSVGGSSEVEIKERRDRVDDAIAATRAASEEGIVVGGGLSLYNCVKALTVRSFTDKNTDVVAGYNLVLKALLKPIIQIAENAGLNGDVVINNIDVERSKGIENETYFGFDASSLEYRNLMDAGVIDPVKVTRLALKHAVSVAGLVLTTEATITNDPADQAQFTNPGMTF